MSRNCGESFSDKPVDGSVGIASGSVVAGRGGGGEVGAGISDESAVVGGDVSSVTEDGLFTASVELAETSGKEPSTMTGGGLFGRVGGTSSASLVSLCEIEGLLANIGESPPGESSPADSATAACEPLMLVW